MLQCLLQVQYILIIKLTVVGYRYVSQIMNCTKLAIRK